jgi:hypothetical protein
MRQLYSFFFLLLFSGDLRRGLFLRRSVGLALLRATPHSAGYSTCAGPFPASPAIAPIAAPPAAPRAAPATRPPLA